MLKWIALLTIAVIGYIVWRRKSKKAAPKLAPQVARPTIKPQTPGNGTPLFHGIRVVEIGNTIAVPMLGRLMAEMGAEVIKVEPPSGDYWRNWLLNYEKPRTQGSSFEAANLGKNSITADFRKPEQLAFVKKLLKDADVVITNTRPTSLERLGMTQAEVVKEFPHLINCALCAWGHLGEENGLPGYDLGAFWAATGMASMVHVPGFYNVYPVGMGDLTSSSAMLAAVSAALRRRLVTGEGGTIQGSLLRTGAFVLTSELVGLETKAPKQPSGKVMNGVDVALGDEIPDYTNKPQQHSLRRSYVTNDNEVFTLGLIDFDSKEEQRVNKAVRTTFGVSGVDHETLHQYFQTQSWKTVRESLEQNHIPFCRATPVLEVCDLPSFEKEEHVQTSGGFAPPIESTKDIPRWLRVPMQLDCSSQHASVRGAPGLGAHNDSIKADGWSPVSEAARLPTEVQKGDLAAQMSTQGPLCDVVVVEYGNVIAASTGVMLADMGATVYVLEPKGGLAVRKSDPALARQLLRGKRSVTVTLEKGHADLKRVRALLERANVFVCDLERAPLAELGLDSATLRKQLPKLIVARSTLWGQEANGGKLDPNAVFWSYSGLLSSAGGAPMHPKSDLPLPTRHFAQQMCSIQLAGGISAALFHQARTGEGQAVDITVLRCALWLHSVCMCVVVSRDLPKAALFMAPAEKRKDEFLVPTAHSVKSSDGQYVQLLGAELPRHFSRTLKAFGISPLFYLKLLGVVVTKVLPSKEKILAKKVLPVMCLLNQTIRAHAAKMTFDEMKEAFAKHDVWYCVNRMPANFKGYKQAHLNGAFQTDTKSQFLTSSPFDFDFKVTPGTAPAPTIGQHNDE